MIHFYIFVTGVILFFLLLEYFWLTFSIRRIPVRILINGTRGKTTTVRILHQILNQSGRMTFSKTTGDLPELHYPDGSRKRLFRFGPANIKENIFQLLNLIRYKPEIFIMESMALHPEMQHTLSHKIFRPSHIGITNIKRDHMEIMGADETEILHCIAYSFTPGSRKYLPQEMKTEVAEEIIRDPSVVFYTGKPFSKDFPLIPREVIEKNWGLIQKLATDLGFDSPILVDIFEKEWEEMNRQLKIALPSYNVEFFNLFSANDLETTIQFTEHLHAFTFEHSEILLINTRADRPLRSLAFINYFKSLPWVSEIWVVGKGKNFIKKQLKRHGQQINVILFSNTTALVNQIQTGFSKPTRIYGLANHQGMDILLDNLRKLS